MIGNWPRTGSWGTPEFGITESIGNLFGIPQNNISPYFNPYEVTPNTSTATRNPNTTTAPNNSSYRPATGAGNQTTTSGLGTAASPLFSAPAATGNSGNSGGSPYDPYYQDISNKWDAYLNDLGGIGGTFLPQQRQAQEDIAGIQFQKGQETLDTSRASSLKDIANNTRTAFQAGNNYLGSMGAGDSSAASMYQYALTKESNKQVAELNKFVDTQRSTLESTYNTQMAQIQSWFSNAQMAVQQQLAQGRLAKGDQISSISKSILDRALQAAQDIKTNTTNQYNALLTWAANNSTNLGQLSQNIAGVSQKFPSLVNSQLSQGRPTNPYVGMSTSNLTATQNPNTIPQDYSYLFQQ